MQLDSLLDPSPRRQDELGVPFTTEDDLIAMCEDTHLTNNFSEWMALQPIRETDPMWGWKMMCAIFKPQIRERLHFVGQE